MEKIYTRTRTIQEDKVSGFCPGCMHSTVMKLIGEVLEELDQVQNTACAMLMAAELDKNAATVLNDVRRVIVTL